jgi:hypothetical protein
MSTKDMATMVRILQVLFLAAWLLWLSLVLLMQPAQAMAGNSTGWIDPPAIVVGMPPAIQVMSTTFPITVTDQTPTEPLLNPIATAFAPRYVSGFGSDNAFTIFFEDRDQGSRIFYNATTSGPLGFTAASTPTNISAETHFVVKDWPITISDNSYAYRGWGAVGNNELHHFYVSNNLITWTLVSTFTIPNGSSFTGARGSVYYGFHDVIKLNKRYYAFAESNQGQTMMVSSTLGADDWIAFDSVGGTQAADGPLELPESGTPSGSFVLLGDDRGYGKIHVRGDDSGFYLAINLAAKPSLPPADLAAAYIDPANWTWHDGATGLPTTPILTATAEHDLREAWVVPQTDPNDSWVIIYTADFGPADGGKALGYAGAAPPAPGPANTPPIYLPLIFKAAGRTPWNMNNNL